MKRFCILFFTMQLFASLSIANEELFDAVDVIPPQCYAEESVEGIPETYSRESMIDQPELIDRVEPPYPEQPTSERDFFCAAFMFSVGADGTPISIEQLYNSHADVKNVNFAEQAKVALQSWQFKSGLVDKGPAPFLGFTAVFFKGYGDAVSDYVTLKEQGASVSAVGDVEKDWQNYGRSVTQEELEQLEFASERQLSPEAVAVEFQKKKEAEGPKRKMPTSWVVADDGTVMTDYAIYEPEEGEELYQSSAPAIAIIEDSSETDDKTANNVITKSDETIEQPVDILVGEDVPQKEQTSDGEGETEAQD